MVQITFISISNTGDTTLKSIMKSEEELKKFAFMNNLASKSMKNPKGSPP